MVTKSWYRGHVSYALAAVLGLVCSVAVAGLRASTADAVVSWSPTETVGTANTGVGGPAPVSLNEEGDEVFFQMDRDQNGFAAWKSSKWCTTPSSGVCSDDTRLLFSRRPFDGDWDAPIQVNTPGSEVLDWQISVDKSTSHTFGNVRGIIAYSESTGSGSIGFYTRAIAEDGSLDPAIQVASETGATTGEIAVHSIGGEATVAWIGMSGSDQAVHSRDLVDPTTWGPSVLNYSAGSGMDVGNLEVAHNGNEPVITFTDGGQSGQLIGLVRGGTNPSDWGTLTTTNASSDGNCANPGDVTSFPRLITDEGQLRPYIVFACNSDLVFVRLDIGGGSWNPVGGAPSSQIGSGSAVWPIQALSDDNDHFMLTWLAANGDIRNVVAQTSTESFEPDALIYDFSAENRQVRQFYPSWGDALYSMAIAYTTQPPTGNGLAPIRVARLADPDPSVLTASDELTAQASADAPFAIGTTIAGGPAPAYVDLIQSLQIGVQPAGPSQGNGFVTLRETRSDGIASVPMLWDTFPLHPITRGPGALYTQPTSSDSSSSTQLASDPNVISGISGTGFRALSSSSAWQPQLEPSDGSRDVTHFATSPSKDGSVAVVWTDVNAAASRIWMRTRSTDGSWNTPTLIDTVQTPASTTVTDIQVDLNQNGDGWIAWTLLNYDVLTDEAIVLLQRVTDGQSVGSPISHTSCQIGSADDRKQMSLSVGSDGRGLLGCIHATGEATSTFLPTSGPIPPDQSLGNDAQWIRTAWPSGDGNGVVAFAHSADNVLRTSTISPTGTLIGSTESFQGSAPFVFGTGTDYFVLTPMSGGRVGMATFSHNQAGRTRLSWYEHGSSWSAPANVTEYSDPAAASFGNGWETPGVASSSANGQQTRIAVRQASGSGSRIKVIAVGPNGFDDLGATTVEPIANPSNLLTPRVSVDNTGRTVATWMRFDPANSASTPVQAAVVTGANDPDPGPNPNPNPDPDPGPTPADQKIAGCTKATGTNFYRTRIKGTRALLVVDAREELTKSSPLKIYARGSRSALKQLKKLNVTVNSTGKAASSNSPFLVRFVPKNVDRRGTATISTKVTFRKKGVKAQTIDKQLRLEPCKSLFTATRAKGPVKKSYGLLLRAESISKLGTVTITLPKKLRKLVKGKRVGTLKAGTAAKPGTAEQINVSKKGVISTPSGVKFTIKSGLLTVTGLGSGVERADITLGYDGSVWKKAFPKRTCGTYLMAAKFENNTLKTTLRGKSTPVCLVQ